MDKDKISCSKKTTSKNSLKKKILSKLALFVNDFPAELFFEDGGMDHLMNKTGNFSVVLR